MSIDENKRLRLSHMKKNRILVVEDDNDARNALCAMLEGLGHEPISFASAVPVMDAIKGTKIDLAMLDIMMPDMNGYELLQLLRASEEFESIPVFMVTAKNNDDEVLKGYEYGADYYIMKPYTSKQIDYGMKLFLESKGKKGQT
jgi:DNA-binding response OmpR family regulator